MERDEGNDIINVGVHKFTLIRLLFMKYMLQRMVLITNYSLICMYTYFKKGGTNDFWT